VHQQQARDARCGADLSEVSIRPNWVSLLERFGVSSRSIWIYFAVTFASAILSMIRGLFVATACSATDFTRYGVVLYSGYFLGYLLSFGSIEASFKSFPRLSVSGRVREVHELAAAVFWKLGSRAFVLGSALLVAGFSFDQVFFFDAVVAVLLGMIASCTSLTASVQRANGDYGGLAGTALVRTLLALAMVSPAAYFYDFRWVITAELVAGALGVVISSRRAGLNLHGMPSLRSVLDGASDGVFQNLISNRGLLVSVSAIFVSVPFYLDRMFVAAVFGTADAARYALLSIFLGAAILLFNVITQRVGTEAIKLVSQTRSLGEASNYVFKWASGGIAIWLLFVTGVGWLFHSNALPSGLQKYELSIVLLLPAAVLGSLAVTALVEFLLLSVDGESSMFKCAASYLGLIILIAIYVWLEQPPLHALIWMLVIARALYLLFLCGSLRVRSQI